jgi:hypothetical protein
MTPGRFDYIRYDEVSKNEQEFMKDQVEFMEKRINTLQSGRYKALALTALEECYMWIGKAIRDDQVARTKEIPLQEDRDPAADGVPELKHLRRVDGKNGFTFNLCPYKAPEQVKQGLQYIARNFEVEIHFERFPYQTLPKPVIMTTDMKKLAEIELVLLTQRLIQK